MTSVWESLTVDARDPARLARWWAEALGYQVVTEKPDEVEIRQSAGPSARPGLRAGGRGQGAARTGCTSTCAPPTRRPRSSAWSTWAPGTSTSVRATSSWTVLADPEGNEFCVLREREE